MKILLFGSTGMLGNYVKSYLRKQNICVVCIDRKELDVSKVNYNLLQEVLKKYLVKEGDIIINCIGIIPQSKNINSTDIRNYFLINSLFPNMLSTVAYMYGLKFIHITTDCVYNGSGGNYTELDIHDETGEYGVSKSLGELGYNTTIIRTSIIGEEMNHKYALLEWVKKHKNANINGYINHYWNGVTCLQLAKIINKMINNNMFWNGVRHIYSNTKVSKYDLVCMINRVYKLNNTVNKFKTEKNINKTLNSIHDTNDLFNIPELIIQISEMEKYEF